MIWGESQAFLLGFLYSQMLGFFLLRFNEASSLYLKMMFFLASYNLLTVPAIPDASSYI